MQHIQALLKTQVDQFKVQPQILLLPELFNVSYDLDFETAWPQAEPLVEARSCTLRYMRRWAEDFSCFVGGTMLEAGADGHFYNTFVMFDPRGRRLDRLIRKSRPASFEAFVFRGSDVQDHVLELDVSLLPTKNAAAPAGTPLRPLRVGVAICYENMLASVMRPLQAAQLDLLLSPFSAPEPIPLAGFSEAQCDRFRYALEGLPSAVARQLNAYVLSANKAGPWHSLHSKFLGQRVLPPFSCQWLALTGAYAPSGAAQSSLPANSEALCSARITVPAQPRPRSTEPIPAKYRLDGGLTLALPPIVPFSFSLMSTLGGLSYNRLQAGKRERMAKEAFAKPR